MHLFQFNISLLSAYRIKGLLGVNMYVYVCKDTNDYTFYTRFCTTGIHRWRNKSGSGALWCTEAHVKTTLSAALDRPVLFPFEIARVASEKVGLSDTQYEGNNRCQVLSVSGGEAVYKKYGARAHVRSRDASCAKRDTRQTRESTCECENAPLTLPVLLLLLFYNITQSLYSGETLRAD